MAISRRLNEITVRIIEDSAVEVSASVAITDDVEETSTGIVKRFAAPRVVSAAIALRDEIVQQFAGQGRPVAYEFRVGEPSRADPPRGGVGSQGNDPLMGEGPGAVAGSK